VGKVALLLRGGVSRETGRLLNPKQVRLSDSPFVNFQACRESIFKNLVYANPDYDFDIFIQSWVPELAGELDALYSPKASAHEDNLQYSQDIRRLTRRSIFNEVAAAGWHKGYSFWNLRKHYIQTFAGLSQALAIQKAIELMEQNSTPEEYDFVVLYRPDIILLKEIRLSGYNPALVYCNGYSGRMGDFRWVFSPDNRQMFLNLLASINLGNFHQIHVWIRNYFDSHGFSKTYVSDVIQAGRDEEVLRKVKLVGIPYEKVREFGISEPQYSRYC
jgi:hypothetical protein